MPSMPESITGRLLPPEEWGEKLQGTLLDGRPLDPRSMLVLAVEEDGVVVAHAAILMAAHIDALWTAESHRGHAGVARALVTAITEALVQQRIPEVLALSQLEETDALYQHAGGRALPGTLWVIPVTPGGRPT